MLRPASEINFPPSEADCLKAKMLSRMEALSASSNALMSVIAERISAEDMNNREEVATLTAEQDRLLADMQGLVAKSA